MTDFRVETKGIAGATSVSNADGTLTISPNAGLVVASRPAITGDVAIAGASNASVLATVNSNVGSFTNSSITVNGKGLVTAASSGTTPPSLPLSVANGGTGSSTLIGAGIPQIVASADLMGQTGAVASVVAATSPNDGNPHTYSVGAYINVTAILVDVAQVQITYTDENSAAITATFFPQGLTSANIANTGDFPFPPNTIRVKANSLITLKTILTTGTGSITYDVGGYIMQIN